MAANHLEHMDYAPNAGRRIHADGAYYAMHMERVNSAEIHGRGSAEMGRSRRSEATSDDRSRVRLYLRRSPRNFLVG